MTVTTNESQPVLQLCSHCFVSRSSRTFLIVRVAIDSSADEEAPAATFETGSYQIRPCISSFSQGHQLYRLDSVSETGIREVRILQTGSEIATLPDILGEVTVCDVSPVDSRFIVCDNLGFVYVLKLEHVSLFTAVAVLMGSKQGRWGIGGQVLSR